PVSLSLVTVKVLGRSRPSSASTQGTKERRRARRAGEGDFRGDPERRERSRCVNMADSSSRGGLCPDSWCKSLARTTHQCDFLEENGSRDSENWGKKADRGRRAGGVRPRRYSSCKKENQSRDGQGVEEGTAP